MQQKVEREQRILSHRIREVCVYAHIIVEYVHVLCE